MQDTPNALLKEIQEGSDAGFATLVKQYTPLITSLVSSFCASGGGARDDLQQEAESALLKASLTYDSTQNAVSFGLYAKICMRNALISHRRKVLRRSRRDMSKKLSRQGKSMHNVFVQTQNLVQKLEKLEKVLSPYERQVLREYISGKSVPEIAEDVGKSSKSVHNALFRIREKGKQFERCVATD